MMSGKLAKRVWLVLAALLCTAPAHAEDFTWEEVEILHLRGGFPLSGTHLNTDCTACHSGGRFEGTPTRCAACHARTGMVTASARSARHLPTTDNCDACHSEDRWESRAVVDHYAVRGDCRGCHNGTMAKGKGRAHVVSGADCASCHRSTLTFHNARYDHAGVTQPCSTCHNGATADGLPSGHLISPEPCDTCHDTRNWANIHYDHGPVTPGTCVTCHDGRGATGIPKDHPPTTLACDACHSMNGWLPAEYRHTSAAWPGDHRRSLSCESCHVGGGGTVRWRDASLAPDCGGCHAGDYRAAKHPKIDSPRTNYTAAELKDCTGACHIYENAAMTRFNARRTGPHHRVSHSSFDD